MDPTRRDELIEELGFLEGVVIAYQGAMKKSVQPIPIEMMAQSMRWGALMHLRLDELASEVATKQ